MSCYDPLMESGLDSKIFKYFGLCHVLDLVRLYAYKHQLSRYSPKKVALHYNYMKKYIHPNIVFLIGNAVAMLPPQHES